MTAWGFRFGPVGACAVAVALDIFGLFTGGCAWLGLWRDVGGQGSFSNMRLGVMDGVNTAILRKPCQFGD